MCGCRRLFSLLTREVGGRRRADLANAVKWTGMRHDYGVALIGTSQIEDGGINFTCLGFIILLPFIYIVSRSSLI